MPGTFKGKTVVSTGREMGLLKHLHLMMLSTTDLAFRKSNLCRRVSRSKTEDMKFRGSLPQEQAWNSIDLST